MKRIVIFLTIALLCAPVCAFALTFSACDMQGVFNDGGVSDMRYFLDEFGEEDGQLINVDLSGFSFELEMFFSEIGESPTGLYDKWIEFKISIPEYELQAHDEDYWPNKFSPIGGYLHYLPDNSYILRAETPSTLIDAIFYEDGTGSIYGNFGDTYAPGVMWIDADFTYSIRPVPEPSTILLLGLGLTGIISKRKFSKIKKCS